MMLVVMMLVVMTRVVMMLVVIMLVVMMIVVSVIVVMMIVVVVNCSVSHRLQIVQVNGKDSFGEFKSIFMSMLDVTSYERNILVTANILLESDTHRKAQKLWKMKTKALPQTEVKIREPPSAQQQQQQQQQQQAPQQQAALELHKKDPVERLVIPENESKVNFSF